MHPTSSPGVGEADAIVLAGRYVEGTGPAIAGHSTVPAPTLERRLERWAASGLHRIVLCAPDATVTLREQFGDAANGVRLDYVDADPALGSGGALRLAAERLRTPTAWILPSDPRGHLDLFGVWEWHHLRPSRITVATAHLADTRFLHRLEVDASDRVRAISVRDRVGGAGRVGLGFYLLHARVLRGIPDDRPLSLESELLPRWAESGGLFAYPPPATGRTFEAGPRQARVSAERRLEASTAA